MGRKRASFAEGIAEEDQRYAQVLRDIRDLRGETQQALGRLLAGASPRFPGLKPAPSVLTRRRTGATARWRQPRNFASA
jgi:hypothetical protein